MVDEVEDLYDIRIEQVVVGDRPIDERFVALIGAIREACVNAAKHSAVVDVSVYVEITRRRGRGVRARSRGRLRRRRRARKATGSASRSAAASSASAARPSSNRRRVRAPRCACRSPCDVHAATNDETRR